MYEIAYLFPTATTQTRTVLHRIVHYSKEAKKLLRKLSKLPKPPNMDNLLLFVYLTENSNRTRNGLMLRRIPRQQVNHSPKQQTNAQSKFAFISLSRTDRPENATRRQRLAVDGGEAVNPRSGRALGRTGLFIILQ